MMDESPLEKECGEGPQAEDGIVPKLWAFDEQAVSYPYEVFAKLQEEAPCHFDEGLGAWVITRADDVEALLRHSCLSAGAVRKFLERVPESFREEFRDLEEFFNAWMVFSEGVNHLNLRKTLAPAFSMRRVQEYVEAFGRVADETLDEKVVAGKDLIKEVIQPYAFGCMATYLGLQQGDFPDVKRWCDELIGFISTSEPEQERAESATAALAEFRKFLLDTVTPLVESGNAPPVLQCGAELSELEFAGVYAQILTGSFDPVTNALAVGTFELAKNRDQLAILMSHDQEYRHIGSGRTVEEILRFSTPFRLAPRVTLSPVKLHDTEIPGDARVLLMLAAANRDPAWYSAPQKFDLERDGRRHLAFGIGGHYCLGAAMAREQMIVAVERIAPQLENLVPESDTIELEPYLGSTTPKKLILRGVH